EPGVPRDHDVVAPRARDRLPCEVRSPRRERSVARQDVGAFWRTGAGRAFGRRCEREGGVAVAAEVRPFARHLAAPCVIVAVRVDAHAIGGTRPRWKRGGLVLWAGPGFGVGTENGTPWPERRPGGRGGVGVV